MEIDLCARVNFRPRRVVRNGVAYVGFVSAHRTQVNNDGACRRITAELMLDPARGKLGLAIMSSGKLCYGGFGNANGKVVGVLRGVLAGHLVLFFSTTDCDPVRAKTRLSTSCDLPPDEDSRCYERPIPPGRPCIYCVDTSETPVIECTIEQDTDTYPCEALGPPLGDKLMPYGFQIYPDAGMFDLTGDDGPFRAQSGLTGRVKYYLQSAVRLKVDPHFIHPDDPGGFCVHCGAWLCAMKLHYLNPYVSWLLKCTEVLRPDVPETQFGACCETWGDEFIDCEDTILEYCRVDQYGFEWRGVGSVCEFVDCLSSFWADPLRGACCLSDGRCIEVTRCSCDGVPGPYDPAEECATGGHGGVWHLGTRCHQVVCPDDDPNLVTRPFELYFQNPIGFVVFSAGWETMPGRCFKLMDNQCMTSGPDSDACGGADISPCWLHLRDGDDQIRVLDSLTLDLDMRLAETSQDEVDRYPHHEPECIKIANTALAKVGDLLLGLTGRRRHNSYNRNSLNHWWERVTRDCHEAPVIWPVSVIPYQTPCAFPADLVLTRIDAELHLSGDPGHGWAPTGDQSYWGLVRIAAVFTCRVELKVRLRPGWEQIECPIRIVNDINSLCDPVLSDPDRYMIVASDGCSRVPLEVTWKGLQGPRPYSQGPFAYENRAEVPNMCCKMICAIDGLVIPGEVNDLADPDGLQRYGGDVVLLIDEDVCGCVPREEDDD